MSVIKPFQGYRPPKEAAAKIAALPYDVVSSAEARQIAAGNPCCFFHISKPEIDLDPKIDPHAEEVYQKGAENFQKFIREGLYKLDDKDYLYIYQLAMLGRKQIGVVAGVSADEYEKNLLKKHELTRPDKEEDRVRHTLAVGANTGLVFLTYTVSQEINEVVARLAKNEPEYDFISDDGIKHTFWVVRKAADIKKLVSLFAKIPALYIADGHHRASVGNIIAKKKREANPKHTGSEQYNFFLAGMFPHDQMKIMDYNRVLKELNGLTSEQLLAKIKEKFTLELSDNQKPDKKHTFKMLLDGKWYKLEAKPGTYPEYDPVKSLDVSILQENLLDPVLGIKDPRRDQRIDFVGGIRGIAELEKRCQTDCKLAFAVYPMSIEEMMKIADAQLQVPPKSTWFEPKLRSGLVLKPYL
jgi:uncharacterized protein (DUF1015 family)